MKNIYAVMGGLGKNIIFTSLIPSLCQKDEAEHISIITGWPYIYTSNEQVDQVLPSPGWKHEPILEQYDNVIYHEPYLSNYIKDKNIHIVNDWANGLGITLTNPKPYIKHTYYSNLENDCSLSEPLTKKYCVVQVNGGNEVYGKNVNSPRDYRLDLVQQLISKIRNQLDLDVVCFRLESEPKPSNTITFKSKSEKGVLGILPLIKKAEFVVTIDSALMHFAACTDKKTIALWNTSQTSPERIGYNFQTNLICNNDIAIDIDPNLIMEKINGND
jgi:hypothetical protein